MICRKSEKFVLSARRQKQEEQGCTIVTRIYRRSDSHHVTSLLAWYDHCFTHDTHPPHTEFTTQHVPTRSDTHPLATGLEDGCPIGGHRSLWPRQAGSLRVSELAGRRLDEAAMTMTAGGPAPIQSLFIFADCA